MKILSIHSFSELSKSIILLKTNYFKNIYFHDQKERIIRQRISIPITQLRDVLYNEKQCNYSPA